MSERIAPSRFHAIDWRIVRDDACTHFRTGSLASSVALVDAIGRLAVGADLEPDVDLRSDGVTVRLSTHGLGRLNEGDVELARQISAAARDLDVTVDLAGLQNVQIAIDALVIPDVLPFWSAVLGYEQVDNGTEPYWSPDGSQLAYSYESECPSDRCLATVDADGSNARMLAEKPLGNRVSG